MTRKFMSLFSPVGNVICYYFSFFFFNDTATTEIYTLSLHDALPICPHPAGRRHLARQPRPRAAGEDRSEEHTSELQSLTKLVCRLLLEKKKRHHRSGAGDRRRQGHDQLPRALRGAVQAEAVFFFNDTATTEIYTLSLHDALPI